MLKKYSILYGIIIPILFLLVTAFYYQVGSQRDKSPIGSGWNNNCQNDHLNEKAVDASNNCMPVLRYFQDVVLMRPIRFAPF